VSHDYQAEIAFLGMESSPSFVRQPECNGCVERFIRTLKEQLLWVKVFDLKKGFKKAVQLARISPIRFHDLRHTFATRLIQSGVDIITVQHLLDHAKISVTARYAHSPNIVRIATVRRLDELFALQPDPNRPQEAIWAGQVVALKP
jgi:Phage integrase family